MVSTLAPKVLLTTGKIVLTTLPSNADMNVPTPMALNTHHLRSMLHSKFNYQSPIFKSQWAALYHAIFSTNPGTARQGKCNANFRESFLFPPKDTRCVII